MTTISQETGTQAGNPSKPFTPPTDEPRRMKSIDRFSQDHDWSKWFTYKLIRQGHLKVVQVFGRKRITEGAERAFDEAVERGLLAVPGK